METIQELQNSLQSLRSTAVRQNIPCPDFIGTAGYLQYRDRTKAESNKYAFIERQGSIKVSFLSHPVVIFLTPCPLAQNILIFQHLSHNQTWHQTCMLR
jgi:hypothetical protein